MAKKKEKKKEKEKRMVSQQGGHQISARLVIGVCYAVKRFLTKERTMLSFEQCGSFNIKKMFGDQGVEHKRILQNTQFQSDMSLNSHNCSYHTYLIRICKFPYSFPQQYSIFTVES